MKKMLSFVMACSMVCTCLAVQLSAKQNTTDSGLDCMSATYFDFDQDGSASGDEIEAPESRSLNQFTDEVFEYSENVTVDDPTDFYFFSAPANRQLVFNIASSNINCVMQLCLMDCKRQTRQLSPM